MILRVNWDRRRCKHALERMWLRGVSIADATEAINKGQKIKQTDKVTESIYKYFSVVYEEKFFSQVRKIFPITVKIL